MLETTANHKTTTFLPRLKALSIRTKLAIIFAIGTSLIFAATFLLVAKQNHAFTRELQQNNEQLVAELLIGQIQAPVQFKDSKRLEEIFAPAIESDPTLEWIDITHVSGEKLAFYDGGGTAPRVLETSIKRALDTMAMQTDLEGYPFLISMPIMAKDNQSAVGVASFAWNHGIFMRLQDAELRKVLLISVLIAIAGLLVVMLAISRLVTGPLSSLTASMEAVSKRDFETDVSGTSRLDEIGSMATKLAILRDALKQEDSDRAKRREETALRQKLFEKLGQQMSQLAKGRTDCHIDVSNFVGLDDDHKKICQNFNDVLDNLRSMLSTIVSTAESVRTSALEISDTAGHQSKRSEAQAATLEESAAAIDELNSSVQKTAQLAADANTRIADNKTLAAAGGEVVNRTVKAMRDIEQSSQQITAIIGVIDDIAFQTNLLALNAGVEAARAGEAGRGFAVVASEVRALAQRASDSANEIKELILRSGEHVTDGSELATQAGSSLTEIIAGVNHLSDLVSLIAAGSSEQATNLSEIKESVNQLDSDTQKNAAVIEESSAASQSLSHEAARMMDALKQFTINNVEEIGAVFEDHPPLGGATTWQEEIEEVKAHDPVQFTSNRPSRVHPAAVKQGAANLAEEGWEEF